MVVLLAQFALFCALAVAGSLLRLLPGLLSCSRLLLSLLRGVLDEVDTANWAATMCVVLAVYVFIPAGYLRKDRHPEGGIIDYMPGAHLSGPDVTGRPPP